MVCGPLVVFGECKARDEMEVPVVESKVGLVTSDDEQDALEVTLVHLEDPKAGVYSQSKKQCDLWEFVWGTSLLTASFLSKLNMDGLNLLEIGGGSGLCSLTCALKGCGHVTMTDLVLDATTMCKLSAEANKLTMDKIDFKTLDWNKPEVVPEDAYDVIIASDVLFYRGCVNPVASLFAKALRPGGIGILADPCRCNTDDFESKLDDFGIRTTTYVFLPEMIKRAQNLAQKAFVDVKRVKLLVFVKGDEPNPKVQPFWNDLNDKLPSFVTLSDGE